MFKKLCWILIALLLGPMVVPAPLANRNSLQPPSCFQTNEIKSILDRFKKECSSSDSKTDFEEVFKRMESDLKKIEKIPVAQFLQLTTDDWLYFHDILYMLLNLLKIPNESTDEMLSITQSVRTLFEKHYDTFFISGDFFKKEYYASNPLLTYLSCLHLNTEENSNDIIWAYLHYFGASRKEDPTADLIPLSEKITFEHIEQFLITTQNIYREQLSYSQLEFLLITLIRRHNREQDWEQRWEQKNIRETIFQNMLQDWKKIPALKSSAPDAEHKIRQLCTVILLHLTFEEATQSKWNLLLKKTSEEFFGSTKENPYSKEIPVAVYLREADLEGSDLTEVDFSLCPPANLEQANFKNTILRHANFFNANLKQANFKGAKLEGAIFDDAFLNEADLSDSFLYKALFFGANLEKTILNNAKNIHTVAVGKAFNGKTKTSAQNSHFFATEQLELMELVFPSYVESSL